LNLVKEKAPRAFRKPTSTTGRPGSAIGSSPCRLNKAIAACGIASRRDADELIKAGKVSVNGVTVTNLATVVNPGKDVLKVEGKSILSKELTYIALHKPKGVITSCEDEKNRRTVLDLLPPDLKHLKPVGRLDRDSSGLLIMTNDGELTYTLTHPSQEVDKTYVVTISGLLTREHARKLSEGIALEDGITRPALVKILSSGPEQSSFEIVIHEGRNRQIRRMCSQLGLPVVRLVRAAIGGLQLTGLKPGTWRVLSNTEIKSLRGAQKQVSIHNKESSPERKTPQSERRGKRAER
jgi:23S rRNA pseudouridine2605 synthase